MNYKNIGLGVLLLAIITGASSIFIVEQTEQAMVLAFGEPKRVIKTPGLNYKIPLIENVIFYDKRLLNLDPEPQEVNLEGKKRLIVDSFTRYKITDPLAFYQSLRNTYNAESQIENAINSSVREVLGKASLEDLLFEGSNETENSQENISKRQKIMKTIKARVEEKTAPMGVEIADVRIKRADLPTQVYESVVNRMISERIQEAKEFRAQGEELALFIKAKADRQRQEILADAKKQSEIIKGQGDKEAAKIWAEAANQDSGFYEFYRSLLAYKKAFNDENKASLVISPDSDFLKFFNRSPSKSQGE